MNFKKNGGFTLVELIVVIAILGLLAGIGVPLYSQYVEKAQIAVEEQQISMYHNAYVVACVSNGIDPEKYQPVVNMTQDGVFTGLSGIQQRAGENPTAKAAQEFNDYFGFPGKSYTFKKKTVQEVSDGIRDGLAEGGSNSGVVDNGDGTYTVKFQLSNGTSLDLVVDKTVADKLKNNTFADSEALGADVLLGKVDTVAGIASGLLDPDNEGKPNSTFEKLIYTTEDGKNDGGDYIASLIDSLGLTEEEDMAKLVALSRDENGNLNSSFLANSLVLTAASKTESINPSDFLGKAGSAAELRSQLDCTDKETSTTAMAKLALTYGMYTSYVNSAQGKANGATDETAKMLETGDFSGMTAILGKIEGEDSGFNAYLASDEGKADLAAYQASMKIVNDAANESPDAAMDILANGFDDPDLVAVLGGLMGNTTN